MDILSDWAVLLLPVVLKTSEKNVLADIFVLGFLALWFLFSVWVGEAGRVLEEEVLFCT